MEEHDLQGEMNQLFSDWSESQKRSIPELLELIYRDLRQIAQGYMRKERPNHTLQTTALVNEAYLRMFQGQPFEWKNRKHVFCMMAQTMRRILVDYARNRYAHKRGGDQRRLSFDKALLISAERSPELFALDEALERLMRLHVRQGQVVEFRFFAGLSVEETAAVLGVSPETVKLDWRFAKAWLQRELGQTR